MSSVVILKKGPVVEAEKNIPSQLRVRFSSEATINIYLFIENIIFVQGEPVFALFWAYSNVGKYLLFIFNSIIGGLFWLIYFV